MDTPYEILDEIFNNGIIQSNENFDLCCPDCIQNMNGNDVGIYVLASVNKYLEFAEAMGCTAAVPALSDTTEQPLGDIDSGCNCCTHIKASLQKYLQYAEFVGVNPPNPEVPCSDNFNSCVNALFSGLTQVEINEILSDGIIEYGSISGSSQLCRINDYVELVNSLTNNVSSKKEIIQNILTNGIVISCLNDEIVIGNIATWKSYAEAIGLTIVLP
jgi:hypothetical protein